MSRFVCLAAVAGFAGFAGDAAACSVDDSFLVPLGESVPARPLLLVGVNVATPRLYDASDVEVATSRVPFVTSFFGSGERLLVVEPLTVGATYHLAPEIDPSTAIATFTATAEDDETPAAPVIEVVEVSPPPPPEEVFCTSNGTATLRLASVDDVAVVEVATGGRRFFNLPNEEGEFFVEGVDDVEFGVVVLDAAGNPSSPVTVTVAFGPAPEPLVDSCSGCGNDQVVVGFLLPVALLRRRRR